MTAMNFPSPATPGQIYAPPDGPVYRYDPPVWTVIAGVPDAPVIDAPDSQHYVRTVGAWVLGYTKAAIDALLGTKIGEAPNDSVQYVRKSLDWSPVVVPPGTVASDTPPVSPVSGQLWWESDSGSLYYYYNDGSTSQWVQVNVAPLPPIVRTAESRNRIVNPAMQISQEYGSTVVGGDGVHPADQWRMNTSVTGTVAARQGSSGDYVYLQSFNVVTASVPAAGYTQHIQMVEGIRVADFFWGTANARQVVLRFDAAADIAGVYGVCVINTAGTRSFIKAVTLTSAFQTFVVVIPPMTTGVWPTDNTACLSVRFIAAAGTNHHGVEGWQNSSALTVPAQVNLASQTLKNLIFKNVGLYLDPGNTGLAPPWQMPDEAEELRACMRYFEKGGATFDGSVTGGQAYSSPAYYKVSKRSGPAVSISNQSTSGFPTTGNADLGGGRVDGYKSWRAAIATTGGSWFENWTANARM